MPKHGQVRTDAPVGRAGDNALMFDALDACGMAVNHSGYAQCDCNIGA